MKEKLKIEGMTCMHCSASVEKALSEVEGVKSVKVILKKNTAILNHDGSVEKAVLEKAVEDAGYKIV